MTQQSHNETTGPLCEITVEGQELTLLAEHSPLNVYQRGRGVELGATEPTNPPLVELVLSSYPYVAASNQSPGLNH